MTDVRTSRPMSAYINSVGTTRKAYVGLPLLNKLSKNVGEV